MSKSVSSPAIRQPEFHGPLNGRYQILKILAARPWGRTFLAQDQQRPSQPPCVIHHLKSVPAIPSYADAVRNLFSREAAILEQIGVHDQIPQFLACFEDAQGFYVVQEWIEGIPLSQTLQPGIRWPEFEVIQLLKQVLEPLAFVHYHGSLHGHLKPSNVLRRTQDRKLVLIDFGGMPDIQMAFMVAHGLPVPDQEAVELGYQPLEQLQGLPCPASDVYALGLMAVQALTGVVPTQMEFDQETTEILWKEHYRSSSAGRYQGLVKLLDGMVQWDLTKRLATAGDALQILEDVLQEEVEPSFAIPGTAALALSKSVTGAQPGVVQVEVSGSSMQSADRGEWIAVGGSELVSRGESELRPPLQSDAPEPRQPNPRQTVGAQIGRCFQGAIANPAFRLGAGGTVLATSFAALGWTVFHASPQVAEKGNKLWERISRVPQLFNDDPTRPSARSMTDRWRKEWQSATETFHQAEYAYSLGKWGQVKQLVQTMPDDIPYWKERGTTLAAQATANAETAAHQAMQTAYAEAYQRNFTAALVHLKQVEPGTSVGDLAQEKTREYAQKQTIKAWADLQRAYDRAEMRDFTRALDYLWQIPPGTPAHAIAQQKIAEYRLKQKARSQTLIKAADDKANQQNLVAALTSLETMADDNPLDGQVEARITQYTRQLNQKADQWLQKALQQANQGQVTAALASLETIPMGTPAYGEAREKIAELTARKYRYPLRQESTPQNVALKPDAVGQDLNPGNRFREATPMLISRAEPGMSK